MKQVTVRPAALVELEDAANYYEGERSGLGQRLIDDFYNALVRIQEAPDLGSNRYNHLLENVRMHVLRGFPYLIFYFADSRQVEIIRFLHGHRDVSAILGDEGVE